MGVKDILPAAEIAVVVRTAQEHGAAVSYKMTAGGRQEPYEINSTWWSAVNAPGTNEEIEFQVKRYVASRSLALAIPGVPGIYIHGALGSLNDRERAEQTGARREVNRGIIDSADVADQLLRLRIPPADLPVKAPRWRDLITGRAISTQKGALALSLQPYDVAWLEPEPS